LGSEPQGLPEGAVRGKSRREFAAEQKAVVLREHLIEKVSVADLCDKHGLQPTAFCRRQNELLENLVALFERRGHKSNANALEERVEALRERLARKDAIIAEIMGDCVAARRRLGRADSGTADSVQCVAFSTIQELLAACRNE